jgi:phosphotriesterase-related protein
MVGPGTALGGDEPLVELFVKELTEGIGMTGVRAGMLKCATGTNGFTVGVERVLRAVAAAHRVTGAPITTHSVARLLQGPPQQDMLASEGVDLRRVVIGHCGDSTDLDYLRKIADRGSYLGMDQFGVEHMCPFEVRVQTVVQLCELGYAERILLSQDYACFADILPDEAKAVLNPNWSYYRVTRDVVPALLKQGVSELDITHMLVNNPRTILGMTGS